jgi:cytochrome c oxidase subunit I
MADVLHTPVAGGHHHPEPAFLDEGWSLKEWLTTVDHKKIGIMYLFSTVFMFLVGGIFALLVRTELIAPGQTIMTADQYNQAFTLHGAIMVFMFIIPAIPGAVANFVMPLMLGAQDVAFPKLNLASLYIYWTGTVMAIASILGGAVDTGWTFYTPYSTTTKTGQVFDWFDPVVMMTMSVFVLGFSSILTGLNFIATIHKMRAPGMTWFQLPLFVWGIYATSLIQVLATPVIGITMALLLMERVFHIGIFDPSLGGDPVLFQHFFWFYSHPAVYIMILPGMAIISEIIPVFSKKTIFGYRGIGFSSVAIALVGFLVWGHHMFVSGQSNLAVAVFSFLTFLVAIPSGIKVFNWLATMWRGSIDLKTPMVYACMFLILFGIGGLTGIFLGALAVDVHLTDTYFVVAHFHYVMMGGTVIAFFGGLHYWWPKMFGRMYNETVGYAAAALIFIGFNATFLTQFVLGSRGMPRRYYNYLDQFTQLHAFSTWGSYILGLGIALMFVNLFVTLFKQRDASPNPWGGRTLEWETDTPPITHNFHETPVLSHGPYDYRPATLAASPVGVRHAQK